MISISSLVPPNLPVAGEPSFTFAFAGDTGQYGASYGTGQNGTASFVNSAASLQALPSGLSFFVDDGDLSYNGTSNNNPATGIEVLWCNFVKANTQANLGPNFPWIQVVGNHDDGNSTFAKDGYIDAFTSPNCLPKPAGLGFIPSAVGCPDATLYSGCYGREGYWDFPPGQPLARFIVIAPADKVGNGTVTTAYNYCPMSACNSQMMDKRWSWLKTTIDQAKASGEWVIVFSHKPCLSPDLETTCEGNGIFNGHNPDAQLWNLFFSEGVDLVINGHAHIHARSKQLTCLGPVEPVTDHHLPFALSSIIYSPSCVADDGSDNTYTRGRGVVNVIEGDFSQMDGQLNFTRADTSYFSDAMSPRALPTSSPYYCCWTSSSAMDMNSGVGFGEVTISATTLSYSWHMSLLTHFVGSKSPTFSDNFIIQNGSQQPWQNRLASFLLGNIAPVTGIGAFAAVLVAIMGILRKRRRATNISHKTQP